MFHFPEELSRFWRDYDRRLSRFRAGASAADIDLTHNLYRGMPALFNQFFAFWQYRAIRRLLQASRPRPGEWVLDLGCGTGRWSRFFQRFGTQTIGVDIGVQALYWARRLTSSGSWAVMAIPHLGFRNSSFDWIISVTVLQHLPYEMQEMALQEAYRLLRPGGKLIVLELCQPADRSLYLFPRVLSEWERLFSQTNLQIVQKQPSELLPWISIFRRLAMWACKSPKRDRRLLIDQAAGWFERGPWPWIALYLFLAVAYPLEGLAWFLGVRRWARYTAWLLRRES